MLNFTPAETSANIVSAKESFLASGRLDAEYYHPKYEDYRKLITGYANGWDTVANLCRLKDGNYNPESDANYRYIELANIGKMGDITGCSHSRGEELPSRARRMVRKGNVIVSSIEGSLDSCALVTKAYDGSLCSTGFYVVDSHVINPETLLLLFKSVPVRNLMKRGCSGTILSAIGKDEFSSLPLPLIPEKAQREIAERLQQSMSLRNEAERLLEEAKFQVEQAIETA